MNRRLAILAVAIVAPTVGAALKGTPPFSEQRAERLASSPDMAALVELRGRLATLGGLPPRPGRVKLDPRVWKRRTGPGASEWGERWPAAEARAMAETLGADVAPYEKVVDCEGDAGKLSPCRLQDADAFVGVGRSKIRDDRAVLHVKVWLAVDGVRASTAIAVLEFRLARAGGGWTVVGVSEVARGN
jgi:hypothetical protein